MVCRFDQLATSNYNANVLVCMLAYIDTDVMWEMWDNVGICSPE